MKRVWVVGLTAAVLLVALGIMAWYLLQDRESVDFEKDDVDYALAAVPVDSAFFVGMPLDEATNPSLARIGFLISDVQTQVRDLQTHHGVTPDAFLTWTGETAAVAVTSVRRDAFTGAFDAEWVLIVESRNDLNGRAFVEQVAAHWTETGRSVEETENEDGSLIFSSVHPDTAEPEAIAYAGRIVLFGHPNAVSAALEARNGAALENDPHYRSLLQRLPLERPLTFALQTHRLGRLALDAALASLPIALPEIPLEAYGLTVGTLTATDQQVFIDAYTQVDLEQFTPTQRQLFETVAGDAQTAVHVPDAALLYVNGSGADLYWRLYSESAAADAGVENPLQPLLAQANDLLGIDLEAGLIDLLDGRAALMLMPGEGGAVAALAETRLDAALLVQSSQPKQIVNTLQQLHGVLTGGFLPVGTVQQTNTSDGQTLYATSVLLFPDVTLYYGTTQTDLAFGTSTLALDALVYDQTGSFADRADFQALLGRFPAQMTPGLFADVDALVAHLAAQGQFSSEQTAFWSEFDFGGTAVGIDGDVQKTNIILILK